MNPAAREADSPVIPYERFRDAGLPSAAARPRWLNLAVTVTALCVLAGFAVGFPPAAGASAVDWSRDVAVSEIVAAAWDAGIRHTFGSERDVATALFVPVAVTGLVAFCRVRTLRARRVVLAANVCLPVLWLGWFWLPATTVMLPVLPLALAGRCRGETWGEGWVCHSAMGWWSLLWVAVVIVLTVRAMMAEE